MGILSKLLSSFSKQKPDQPGKSDSDLLREFVYLDEVSVYSILASYKSGIAMEFTESRTASLNSVDHNTASVGIGENKLGVGSQKNIGRSQGNQVLRKAIVQTSFKELCDLQKAIPKLAPLKPGEPPEITNIADLEENIDSLTENRWIIRPSTFVRGQLVEAEVALEAEPIFRVISVITTLRELFEHNEELIGTMMVSQLAQMRSIAQVLDNLLSGLIPIRGCLIDYKSIKINDEDVLVHRRILDQLASEAFSLVKPAYIVGVAESGLFWKDIRRVLFSGAQYTVYCRLSGSGLVDRWHPIKVASVLSEIVPQFDNLIREFGEQAERTMKAASKKSSKNANHEQQKALTAAKSYLDGLLAYHNSSLDPRDIQILLETLPSDCNWLTSTAQRRPVFAELTRKVDKKLNSKTPPEIACCLRQDVAREFGMLRMHANRLSNEECGESKSDSEASERFLDAEIIAIYW